MKTVLGFCGPAGSGKDTAANYLVEYHGFVRISFAQPIYDMLDAMGFPAPATREEKEAINPRWGLSWRHAAQTLGTEWGRKLDQDIWLRILVHRIKDSKHDKFVISDVRFENEAHTIRDNGGRILHLTGRAADLGARANHASEALVKFKADEDWKIDNSQGIEDMHAQLSYFLLEKL